MKRYTLFILFIFFSHFLIANNINRQCISVNNNWTIYPAYNVYKNVKKEHVDLPHTWNATDCLSRMNYSRETMIYEKELFVKKEWDGKRLFLRFEGVNSVANIFINGKMLGEHIGGYTAFCYEITDYVQAGQKAHISVFVSNAYRTDVLPLSGDFNVYGGIHRPVSLIITERDCISPLDYGSYGVYVKPDTVSSKIAVFSVQSILSIKNNDAVLELRTTILDKENRVVLQNKKEIKGSQNKSAIQHFNLKNPILWNGKKNPYCYKVCVELLRDGKIVDKVIEKTGFRYFSVDPEKGFFLNGEYLDLHGFGRHEDVAGKASALTNEDYLRDMDLILESGATAMRLTHYPHSNPIYNLSDSSGIILWTEIPFVGPGGYTSPGFVESKKLKQNIRTMLIEMIRQHLNHPSVFFWGLLNELKLDYDNPVSFVKELNDLAKKEDPSRLTTCASFGYQTDFIGATDLIGWNEYFGWYNGMPEEMGAFLDSMKKKADGYPICISEYGAGASIKQHQFPVEKPKAKGKFHPEEWQSVYHERNWKELAARKYVWAKFVWNFADFGSSIRNEGDRQGINDKGLITYDRQVKKDAFYFYKANWNPDAMVYITSRRFVQRQELLTDIKIYSNLNSVEFYVNGEKIGTKKPDLFKTIIWKNVRLQYGENKIEVKGKNKKDEIKDACIWYVQKKK